MNGLQIILSQCLLFLCLVFVNGNVIVNTNNGKVAGKVVQSLLTNEKYFSFLSIPYAEPPVGKLRFLPPQPSQPWNEVLNVQKEKKHCAQYLSGRIGNKLHGFCGDEDCLYLSIHTPKLPSNDNPAMPVIVFIYNEHFRSSFNASKEYTPDFFMKEDVIIVTVQYRMGSLGFLSFEDDLLPGNNGLRDIILALKWIKDNIHNFGGDSKRVTLMGSQTGAGFVDILLHSPKAKGLFSGAILQSGTSWQSAYFHSNSREKAITLTELATDLKASSSSTVIKFLSDVPAMTLTELDHQAVHADEARSIQKPVPAFGPVIEHDHPDAVISKLPDNGPIKLDVPVMVGYNSREGIEFVERYLRKPQYLTFADRDFLLLFPIRVNYHFKVLNNVYYKAVEELKEFYFEEAYVKISRPGEYITYMSDILTVYPIDYTVRKYTNESDTPVYYYMFDYAGELNMKKKQVLKEAINIDGTWGASVGDELCYLFICKPITEAYKKVLEDEESEELKVLKNMIRLWTNFAKTGNPTPPGDEFSWKPATKNNKECLVISDELEMKTRLHDDRIKYWDEFLAKYQAMAKDGVVKDLKDEL